MKLSITTLPAVLMMAGPAMAIWPAPPPLFHLKLESLDNSTNGKYVAMTPMADAPIMLNSLTTEQPTNGAFLLNTTESGDQHLAYSWRPSPELTQAAWIEYDHDDMESFVVHPKKNGLGMKFDSQFTFQGKYLYYKGMDLWYACSPRSDGQYELRYFNGAEGIGYPCSKVRVTKKPLPQPRVD